jgi:enhancing lycopene biosynthesis protein 2
VLSGCGVFDGAEIHESAAVLLALCEAGAEAVCLAPEIELAHVINHRTGEAAQEKRSVLTESARIARGKVTPLHEARAEDLDALIFPGGYGVVKNLCTFAFDGLQAAVESSTETLIRRMHAAGKPIGAVCIAPVLLAKVFEGKNLKLTIGSDASTAEVITALGHRHEVCDVHGVCADKQNRIVSTPAYMLAQNIGEAASGIRQLVREVLVMVKEFKTL